MASLLIVHWIDICLVDGLLIVILFDQLRAIEKLKIIDEMTF